MHSASAELVEYDLSSRVHIGAPRHAAALYPPVRAIARGLRASEGTIIAAAAELSTTVFVLESGVAGLEQRLADGRRNLAALFLADDVVDLTTPEPMRAAGDMGELVALTGVSVAAVPAAELAELLFADAELAALFAERQRRNLRRAVAHARDIGKKTPMERVAGFLYEIRALMGGAAQDVVTIPFPRSDIGDYLGLKSETVSRSIRGLEREGLIKLPRLNRIVISDDAALQRLAAGGRPRASSRTAAPAE